MSHLGGFLGSTAAMEAGILSVQYYQLHSTGYTAQNPSM
jgi:hypothetical protein